MVLDLIWCYWWGLVVICNEEHVLWLYFWYLQNCLQYPGTSKLDTNFIKFLDWPIKSVAKINVQWRLLTSTKKLPPRQGCFLYCMEIKNAKKCWALKRVFLFSMTRFLSPRMSFLSAKMSFPGPTVPPRPINTSSYKTVISAHCSLHCTVLKTALHCSLLNCTALHWNTLSCTALHCTALHCTALSYI